MITHPHISALLQRVRFLPGNRDQHLYALLAPHIGNQGRDKDGWVGDYKGVPMLFARRGPITLALACSAQFGPRSVGYAGTSDGWRDISEHSQMTWRYDRAPNGNLALTAEIPTDGNGTDLVLAPGFGGTPSEAGQAARLAIEQPFDHLMEHFIDEWRASGPDAHRKREIVAPHAPLVPISLAVLRTHESKVVPGGFVASLSIPWGNSHGDDDLGGYHLVWPRDLVEIAGGPLVGGTVRPLAGPFSTWPSREADGDWPQNMWLDGVSYWHGTQMDEIAFPILLAEQLRLAEALGTLDPWPTVRRAASFLVRNGPVTQEDRWEEDPGYSPFTLAVEIAALVVAADFADRVGAYAEATYLRETADLWNTNIERWTYVLGGELAQSLGVDGYYVRIAPEEEGSCLPLASRVLRLKNRESAVADELAAIIISPDALALVRFGLRRADDPRILDHRDRYRSEGRDRHRSGVAPLRR